MLFSCYNQLMLYSLECFYFISCQFKFVALFFVSQQITSVNKDGYSNRKEGKQNNILLIKLINLFIFIRKENLKCLNTS